MSNGHLTPEAIDALPVGTSIYDRDGDEVVRTPEGWTYPQDQLPGFPDSVSTSPALYAPYTLTPKDQTDA